MVSGQLAPGDLLRAMFEGMPEAVLMVDDRGQIVMANPACEDLLGYAPGALVGRSVDDLVPERFPGHAPHRADFMADPRARAMGLGPELDVRCADGSDIPVDIQLAPVQVGGAVHVVATIRDLRQEVLGRVSRAAQSAALWAAANGVVITDPSAIIQWVNPAACRITGYSAEELRGRHTRLLKSGVHDDEFYRGLWTTVTRGDVWTGTIVNRRKDGSLYHEEQTIAPVVNGRGDITHFIAIKLDVTDRVEALRRLEALDASKTTLLHVLAHDLRTPLTNIIGSARTIAEDPSMPAETLVSLATSVARGGILLNRILTDLIDLERIDRGKIEPDWAPVPVEDLVEHLREEVDLGERAFIVESPVSTFMADGPMVLRIIANLVRNAVNHTADEGRVWLRIESDDDGTLICVEDEGEGVPYELQEVIFEQFRQETDSGRTVGVGIGLSLVSEFAQLHGGRAWVEDREGGGASFRVWIPRAP